MTNSDIDAVIVLALIGLIALGMAFGHTIFFIALAVVAFIGLVIVLFVNLFQWIWRDDK